MDLVLVRHAEPIRIGPEETGGEAVDPQLTARGRDQAERLGTWLAAEPVHHVVSSPLRRALETAQPLADAHGLVVETVAGCGSGIPKPTTTSRWKSCARPRATAGRRWSTAAGRITAARTRSVSAPGSSRRSTP